MVLVWRLSLAVAAVFLLATCGPPAGPSDDIYEYGKTRDCLKDAGSRITTSFKEVGPLTFSAPGGGMRVYLKSGNNLTIAFGNTKPEAQRIVKGFQQVPRTPHERRRLRSLLQPEGNAVILWIDEPSREEVELVRNCLR